MATYTFNNVPGGTYSLVTYIENDNGAPIVAKYAVGGTAEQV